MMMMMIVMNTISITMMPAMAIVTITLAIDGGNYW
jgi:hypothetical protein